MIRLDAATVLLQWAGGGLLFLWVTTRRREVGPRLRLAAARRLRADGPRRPRRRRRLPARAGARRRVGAHRGGGRRRPGGVDPAQGAPAWPGSGPRPSGRRPGSRPWSARPDAGVRTRRGSPTPASTSRSTSFDDDRRRVPAGARPRRPGVRPRRHRRRRPRRRARRSRTRLAIARFVVGALFLGSVTDAMLLGHWYLVQPGLARGPLLELVRHTGLTWPFEVGLLLVPVGMVSVWNGTIDDGYGGMLGWFWGLRHHHDRPGLRHPGRPQGALLQRRDGGDRPALPGDPHRLRHRPRGPRRPGRLTIEPVTRAPGRPSWRR